MILEGRLALTPSCFPFFLSCASLPATSLVFRTEFRHHLLQEVFTDALSLGEVSFLSLPVTPIPDSTATLFCLTQNQFLNSWHLEGRKLI